MKNNRIDPFKDCIVNPEDVDLRQAVIFPELVGLTISVNDVLDIVHRVTSSGMFSKEFIDEEVKVQNREYLRNVMEAYNKGLSCADVVIRTSILSRFKKE